MKQYWVVSGKGKDQVVETKRTSRKAAEDDTRLLKEICRKKPVDIVEVGGDA